MTLQARHSRGASSRHPGRAGRRAGMAIGAVVLLGGLAAAQERSPIPAFDGRKHVYVEKGIPGDYRPLEDQIARLEKATSPPYQYRVVVVRSSGPESPTATRTYADDLYADWRARAESERLALDPARSVVVVVAVDNRQVAVHPGTALSALGLRGTTIDEQVVRPSGFLDRARAGEFPQAIAALLDQADRWIASHDTASRRQAEEATVPSPIATTSTPAVEPKATGGSQIGIGLSLLAAALALVVGVWIYHRRTRGRIDQRIKDLRSRATDVMDRLDALKERLKLLPSSRPEFQTAMAGETAALYAKAGQAINALWDRWLQVMDAVDRAEKLSVGVTSPFHRKALHDAETQLNQEGLFEQIDAGVRESSADLDRLDQAHDAATKAMEAVVATRSRLDAPVDEIRKVGLPTSAYQEEMDALGAEVEEARGRIGPDPIGARSSLEALRSRAEALLARAGRVAGLYQEMQKVATSLATLRRQVAEHRTRGLRLDEEGGNPDPALEAADFAQAAVVAALRAGDVDQAAAQVETARSMAEQAGSIVEQVRAAKEYGRRELTERTRNTEKLRSAMPHAESDQQRLEAEFAPSSWEGVRSNLDQVRSLLTTFEHAIADAAAESSDDAQRYLSAARRLRQVAQQQQSALRLMSGIGDRLRELSAIRDDGRKRRAELDAASLRVEEYFRQNDPMVGTMALEILEQARRGRDAVLAAIDRPRPDWPSLKDGLTRASEGFSVASDQAEVDVRTYRQLADEYERARSELERLADLLSARREDRMAANQRFRTAAEVLDRVGLDLSQPHGDWARLLDDVRGAVRDLEHAERLAREDMRLASQAQAEIDDAIRSINQARGSFGMGIGVDTSAAESALERAQQLFASQHYEQAIESAGQSQLAARKAHQDAYQRASWQQMHADAERRRWEGGGSGLGDALTTGAAVAAGVILGNVLGGAARGGTPDAPDPPEPMITPDPPPTDTSVSGWETDTGQGSW